MFPFFNSFGRRFAAPERDDLLFYWKAARDELSGEEASKDMRRITRVMCRASADPSVKNWMARPQFSRFYADPQNSTNRLHFLGYFTFNNRERRNWICQTGRLIDSRDRMAWCLIGSILCVIGVVPFWRCLKPNSLRTRCFDLQMPGYFFVLRPECRRILVRRMVGATDSTRLVAGDTSTLLSSCG